MCTLASVTLGARQDRRGRIARHRHPFRHRPAARRSCRRPTLGDTIGERVVLNCDIAGVGEENTRDTTAADCVPATVDNERLFHTSSLGCILCGVMETRSLAREDGLGFRNVVFCGESHRANVAQGHWGDFLEWF